MTIHMPRQIPDANLSRLLALLKLKKTNLNTHILSPMSCSANLSGYRPTSIEFPFLSTVDIPVKIIFSIFLTVKRTTWLPSLVT